MDVEQVVAWLRRLIYLDFRVFDEVRTNPTATIPGVTVAAISILLSGIGGWLWWWISDFGYSKDVLMHSAILGSVFALVLWGVWLMIVYVMLTQVFRQRAYVEQLLRVMGIATCPLALMLLMIVSPLALAVGLTSLALTFGLTTIAIKTVTTADQAQVLVANAAGFLLWCCALSLLATSSGASVNPHAPGVFLFNTIVDAANDAASFAPP